MNKVRAIVFCMVELLSGVDRSYIWLSLYPLCTASVYLPLPTLAKLCGTLMKTHKCTAYFTLGVILLIQQTVTSTTVLVEARGSPWCQVGHLLPLNPVSD